MTAALILLRPVRYVALIALLKLTVHAVFVLLQHGRVPLPQCSAAE
jgi:hypothetical protein